jgi:hypothetical protein
MGVVIEAAGWFGSIVTLVGFGLFSSGRIGNGRLYQLFNLVGGAAVSVNVASHGALPSTIVNTVWALIAAITLVRMSRRRRGPVLTLVPDAAPSNVVPLLTGPVQVLAPSRHAASSALSAHTMPIGIVGASAAATAV